MRISYVALILVAVAGFQAQAQVADSSPDVRALFNSGLAGSILAADTVPASIASITSASDFGGGFPQFAAGSWLEIKGAGLSSNTRVWAGGDFNGDNAPTSLDNVRVSVNGRPAFVYYISPT